VCEERREMLISVAHYPPYYIIDEGRYSGLIIDIQKLIAKKLNWKFNIFECPTDKRCQYLAAEGGLDIFTDLVVENKASKDYFHYLQPPIETTPSILAFYLLKNAPNLKKFDDLKGLRVGVLITEYAGYPELLNSDLSIQKSPVKTYIQLFKMLAAGRIDTFVEEEVTVDGSLENTRFSDLFTKADFRIERKSANYIVVPNNSPYAIDRFKIEEVLQQLIESGKVQEIFKQYGVEQHPPTEQAPK